MPSIGVRAVWGDDRISIPGDFSRDARHDGAGVEARLSNWPGGHVVMAKLLFSRIVGMFISFFFFWGVVGNDFWVGEISPYFRWLYTCTTL